MSSADPSDASVSTVLNETAMSALPIQASAAGSDATDAPLATRPAVPDEADLAAVPTPVPIPIFQNVSGRYRAITAGWHIELRVDVDRTHSLRRLSADFYTLSGTTVTYFGSFIVDTPVITWTSTTMTARGAGRFTWSAAFPVVQVTIPRRSIFQPLAPATLQFFNAANQPGASYLFSFESGYFRTVRIETDRVSDVTTPVFSGYNTGSLPSGGSARTLSVASSYAEAGIQMVPTAGSDVIDIAEAGPNHTWSDSELHASMVRHFSLYRDEPQWAVWQVVCQLHDLGPGLYGIMFDQLGRQRQGCAVFHAGIGGTTADKLRLQLYTYVHELGHCFNLLHSWQKSFANPPIPNRPAALSWMNYPWNYPGGAAAFWNAFPFQFDDPELVHIRHGFRNNVVMGGNPFATGAAIIDPEVMADQVVDNSGLDFQIKPSHGAYALGEPVVVMMSLGCHDRRGKLVQPYLHPKAKMTSIAILKPSGQAVVYEPLMEHLVASEPELLEGENKITESAYIGFGGGGLYFDQPGQYKLRAIYQSPDGSQIMSNTTTVKVHYPTTAKEQQMADLLLGEEQGALFWLLGSESESLANGRAAFDEILEKHGDHPLANYVRLAQGVHLARTYVTISGHGPMRAQVRPPLLDQANELVAAAAAPNSRVDDLSKLLGLERVERAQRKAGDIEGADANRTKAASLRSTRR